MSNDPRIVVLPRQVASEAITAAVSTGARAVSVVQLVLIMPVLVETFAVRGILGEAALPLAVVIVALAALLASTLRPRRWLYIVYPAIAVAASTAYCLLLVRAAPDIAAGSIYLLNRVPLILILAAPPVRRALLAQIWAACGLVTSLLVIGVADLVAGVSFSPGSGPLLTWAVYASVLLTVGLVHFRGDASIPDIARLERETRRRALESQFEQRAAAMIHDTVLGDLTAVMNAPSRLDDRARERFRADVALLKDPAWLDVADVEVDAQDALLRNGIVELAAEMQWRGLTVDVTGENTAVVLLTPEASDAVHDALRECLENVLRHSGESSAELVCGGDERQLTYMVIDRGVGFDPDAVGEEHLGLRRSVVQRIEQQGGSVRIWSHHGSGTSVLISMPAEQAETR